MKYSIAFDDDQQTVLVSVSGQISVAEWIHAHHQAMVMAGKKGTRRLLLNAKSAHWCLSGSDIDILPKVLEDIGVDQSHRLALVVDSEGGVFQQYVRSFEARGYQIAVVNDVHLAARWLAMEFTHTKREGPSS